MPREDSIITLRSQVIAKPLVKRHDIKSETPHWQLKDLITFGDNGQSIYSSSSRGITRYDLKTRKSTIVYNELNFSPISIAVGPEYIAACAQFGELSLISRDNIVNRRTERICNDVVNKLIFDNVSYNPNITCQTSNSANDRLLVCNNDLSIKIYTIPDMLLIDELSFRTPVNFAAISPDNTKMIVVGDSNQVHLFNRRGQSFEKMTVLKVSGYSSFACDWDQYSTLFGVGGQDGIINIWDIRNLSKLAVFETTKTHGTPRACRNLKFTKYGSVDLLAIGEHDTYVNLIDTRTFDTGQLLTVNESLIPDLDVEPTANTDLNMLYAPTISGVQFSPNCSSIFIATENYTYEYEINVPGRRSFSYWDST